LKIECKGKWLFGMGALVAEQKFGIPIYPCLGAKRRGSQKRSLQKQSICIIPDKT